MSMTLEESKAFMDKIIQDCDREFAQYYVHSGTQVSMSDGSKYVVVITILGDELSKQFSDGKIWKLFSLVHVQSGTNYSYPVPVMSEGSVDIRKLMGMGRYPIKEVSFTKKDLKETRHYTVVDESGYIKTMKVKGR
jgi:hypothetical protein